MGRPWDNGLAKRWWALGRHVHQKEPAPSAEVRRATQRAVHAPPTRLRALGQVSREQEGLRAYAELQRKHRDAYGDNEEAREAAGKAALLRAKALHSPGWAARLRCEERGRLAAASVRRLRGVRQQVHRAQARESHGPWRERERERSRLQSVSVSWCLPVVRKDQRMGRCGVCPRP